MVPCSLARCWSSTSTRKDERKLPKGPRMRFCSRFNKQKYIYIPLYLLDGVESRGSPLRSGTKHVAQDGPAFLLNGPTPKHLHPHLTFYLSGLRSARQLLQILSWTGYGAFKLTRKTMNRVILHFTNKVPSWFLDFPGKKQLLLFFSISKKNNSFLLYLFPHFFYISYPLFTLIG